MVRGLAKLYTSERGKCRAILGLVEENIDHMTWHRSSD